MTLPLVDLGRQYRTIKAEVDSALLAAAESGDYILGEELARFEEEFAAFSETSHCVGVSSGTAAIQLALDALGVGPGDEVIVPANTFIASVLPVLKLGARPVLVDCDDDTATIDTERAAEAVTARTKAVVAVHLYGHPADMGALRRLCEAHDLALVEDACQAHGARFDGRRVGGLGRIAAFSFYPSKNLGAYGDGGALTTGDDGLAERVRRVRDLGQAGKYRYVALGSNERLDTIQAAVLRVKLRRLDEWNERRRRHAAAYDAALADAAVRRPASAEWAEHVWHLYVIRTERRDDVRAALAEAGISTGIHYPLPLHLEPVLRDLGYEEGAFPVAEAWARDALSLPMFAELEAAEIQRVAEAVRAGVGAAALRGAVGA